MEIRPIKENIIKVCIMFTLLTMLSLHMFFDYEKSVKGVVGVAIMSCIWFLIIVNLSIGAGRVYVLDEAGYTVRFLWIEKKYLWEEIRVKTIYYYNFKLGRHKYIIGRAFFSPYKNQYNEIFILLHPFSYLAIEFSDNRKTMKWVERFRYYEPLSYYHVDKDEFLEKMRSWNVELEDITSTRT